MTIEFSYECRFASKYSTCIDSDPSQDNQVLIEHLIAVGVLLENGNLVDLEYYFLHILPHSVKCLAWEVNGDSNRKRLRFEAKRNNSYHQRLYQAIDDPNQDSLATGRYIGLCIRAYIDNSVSYLLTRQSKETVCEANHSSILEELRKTNQLLTTLTVSGFVLGSNVERAPGEAISQEDLLSEVKQKEDNSMDESPDPMARIEEFDFDTLNI